MTAKSNVTETFQRANMTTRAIVALMALSPHIVIIAGLCVAAIVSDAPCRAQVAPVYFGAFLGGGCGPYILPSKSRGRFGK